MAMQARLATQIGTTAFLRIYVGHDKSKCSGTPIGANGTPLTYHNATNQIAVSRELNDWGFAGDVEEYLGDYAHDPRWPKSCEGCRQPWDTIGEEIQRQVFYQRRWDTPSGELEPGCLFWADWGHWDSYIDSSKRDGKVVHWATPTQCPHGWSNCDGRHLRAILPDGHEWDVDGRASNCTMPTDQTHRCWVRSGEPPLVTAGKTGHTCSAGAGSIASPTWHGFLTRGVFV